MPVVETEDWITVAQRAVIAHRKKHQPCKGGCRDLRCDVVLAIGKCGLAFPLRTRFRGVVIRERRLKLDEAVGGFNAGKGEHAVLEVVPERFGLGAYEAIGGVLIIGEGLQAGSVVRVDAELLDPQSYTMKVQALLANVRSLTVEVPVTR